MHLYLQGAVAHILDFVHLDYLTDELLALLAFLALAHMVDTLAYIKVVCLFGVQLSD